MKVIVRTETWNTAAGKVVKAVARTTDGTFLGATNQTEAVPAKRITRPRVNLVGAK
jgi:hypothetical protein